LAALPERGLRPRDLRVTLACGGGGNGGDGFVVARRLKRVGARPDVLLVVPPDRLHGDAAVKFAEMRRTGVAARVVDDAAKVSAALGRADVIVDALLGTGVRGAPTPLVAALIDAINASGRPVVALDVPSGLPADGGRAEGPVVRAWLTPTFAAPKLGLVVGDGADLAGRVVVVPIGVPEAEVARDAQTFLLEASDVAPLFPRRPRDVHKGTYGHLLVLAGSVGKTGAAALCARAALRSGVGLVTVGTAASAQPTVAALSLEAMTEPPPEAPARSLAMKAREPIVGLAEARAALAIGPGLGPDVRVLINPTGNAGMASGGTGDVLTGILGALLARGIDAAQAAPAGVYLHGLAGDIAAERVGEEALIAGDIIDALGEAFRRLADGR